MDKNKGKLPFLSDVIEPERFKKGQANIVVAPCHSGKTTAAITKIASLASVDEKVLLLIDTTAGKQALLTREETARYTEKWLEEIKHEWWGDLVSGNGIRVMTYHQLGYQIQEHPGFMENIDVVICDEMHNLVKFMNIERAQNKKLQKMGGSISSPCEVALEELCKIAVKEEDVPLLVIITATVNPVSKVLDDHKIPVEYFDYTQKAYSDCTKEIVYYNDINKILDEIGDQRAIIYVPTINSMKQLALQTDDGWRNICCLWSEQNHAHTMTEQQLEVREAILKNKRIPDSVDILFINSAYETSINIENEDFRVVVVHSSNSDVQTQVRGRVRHDIDTLYLHDSGHEHIGHYFPEEYLDKFLTVSKTREIAEMLNLKNDKGQLLKWPSISKCLEHDGYSVDKIKENEVRGSVIHRRK